MAISALSRRNSIHFLTTLSVVNAIIQIGNVISAAVSGGSASNQEGLNKTLTALKELLFPDEASEKESRAAKALKVLQREVEGGPLVATPKSVPKRMRGRIIRGQRSVNGSSIS